MQISVLLPLTTCFIYEKCTDLHQILTVGGLGLTFAFGDDPQSILNPGFLKIFIALHTKAIVKVLEASGLLLFLIITLYEDIVCRRQYLFSLELFCIQ